MTPDDSTHTAREIKQLRRRREPLRERQGCHRSALPDWTVVPLRLAGLVEAELRSCVDEPAGQEKVLGGEAKIEQLDARIEVLEDGFLALPTRSLHSVRLVVDLLLDDLARLYPASRDDVAYNHNIARVVMLARKAADDIDHMIEQGRNVVAPAVPISANNRARP